MSDEHQKLTLSQQIRAEEFLYKRDSLPVILTQLKDADTVQNEKLDRIIGYCKSMNDRVTKLEFAKASASAVAGVVAFMVSFVISPILCYLLKRFP